MKKRVLETTGLRLGIENWAPSSSCRYIEGNDFRNKIRAYIDPFCGAPCVLGSSYCEKHTKVTGGIVATGIRH